MEQNINNDVLTLSFEPSYSLDQYKGISEEIAGIEISEFSTVKLVLKGEKLDYHLFQLAVLVKEQFKENCQVEFDFQLSDSQKEVYKNNNLHAIIG